MYLISHKSYIFAAEYEGHCRLLLENVTESDYGPWELDCPSGKYIIHLMSPQMTTKSSKPTESPTISTPNLIVEETTHPPTQDITSVVPPTDHTVWISTLVAVVMIVFIISCAVVVIKICKPIEPNERARIIPSHKTRPTSPPPTTITKTWKKKIMSKLAENCLCPVLKTGAVY